MINISTNYNLYDEQLRVQNNLVFANSSPNMRQQSLKERDLDAKPKSLKARTSV